MFWPTQAFNVYGHDPVQVGIRGEWRPPDHNKYQAIWSSVFLFSAKWLLTQRCFIGIPIGFSILTGACVVLALLSVFRGHNRELLIVSSILMTAGCGSLAIARRDNLYQLWGLLVLAGLGIGGIVVPASIICKCFTVKDGEWQVC